MIVTTASGQLRGTEHDGIVRFLGIPYAAPPVGDRRFLTPAPPEPWSGVRDALQVGPSAPQLPSTIDQVLGWGRRDTSEDCLYLNVWTPGLDETARRPVMVWIHGGAFQSGSGSIPWYSGEHLAAMGDVVVISVNYRLGVLGFLHLADVLDDEYAGSGNAGLLDQIAALGWVRDNITAFGGDPSQVMIFGQSAGAMSVATLLGTPAADGLFHHAIAQSGAAHNASPRATAAEITAKVLEVLGLGPSSARDILTAPIDQILSAQMAVASADLVALDLPDSAALVLPFQPVVDGVVLDEGPLDRIAAGGGSSGSATLVTGTTADEWRVFDLSLRQEPIDEAGLVERCERIFAKALGRGAGREAVDVYRGHGHGGDSPGAVWNAVMADRVFRMPAIRLAEAREKSGDQGATYLYEFTWPAAMLGGILGACHGVEIPFAFANLRGPGVELFLGQVDEEIDALAAATSGAWLSVAHSGDPAVPLLPEWPTYDTDRRATMQLGAACTVVDDPDGARRDFWSGVL